MKIISKINKKLSNAFSKQFYKNTANQTARMDAHKAIVAGKKTVNQATKDAAWATNNIHRKGAKNVLTNSKKQMAEGSEALAKGQAAKQTVKDSERQFVRNAKIGTGVLAGATTLGVGAYGVKKLRNRNTATSE